MLILVLFKINTSTKCLKVKGTNLINMYIVTIFKNKLRGKIVIFENLGSLCSQARSRRARILGGLALLKAALARSKVRAPAILPPLSSNTNVGKKPKKRRMGNGARLPSNPPSSQLRDYTQESIV